MAYAYSSWSVVFGEQPTATKWNILGTNDASFNERIGADFSASTTSPIWYEELGRTTLGSSGDTITVSSIPARKYLRIMIITVTSGATTPILRYNNDSGANYALRYGLDNSFSTAVSSTSIGNLSTGSDSAWVVLDVINIATLQKMSLGRSIYGTNSAGVAPHSLTFESVWNNTSAQISRVDVTNASAGDFASGSAVVVLGHD